MTAGPAGIDPIRKTMHVPLDPARAFEVFTAEMGAWWPLATHSVGQADATGVTFEAGPEGRIIEQLADGTTSMWGTVIEWEPPHRLRFTWHPGTPTAEATEVEVRFSGQGTGTIVELVHSEWERRPDGADARSRYDSGWEPVFRRYLARATAASTSEHPVG